MRVFNLTQQILVYRGRDIGPNGGFADFTELPFVPERDLQLAVDGVISFETLPVGWTPFVPEPDPEPEKKEETDEKSKVVPQDVSKAEPVQIEKRNEKPAEGDEAKKKTEEAPASGDQKDDDKPKYGLKETQKKPSR